MDETTAPQIEYLPIETLKFDPENPRLPGNFDAKIEENVLKWMLDDASLTDLMASIGEQGYFPGEPLLGVKGEDGSVVIIEGNRRLGATKLLLRPDSAPIKKKAVQRVVAESPNIPNALPVLVYPNRNDILSYLGYRHVTGVKAWEPLEKARYLKQLFEIEPDDTDTKKYRSLAKKIGSRSDYVQRLLTGLAIYEKIEEYDFFNIKGLDEDAIDFSVLTTAINYTSLSSFLGLQSATDPTLSGLNIDRLFELTTWIFEKGTDGKTTRIGESRKLKELSKIVESAQALEAWRGGYTLEYSLTLTETPSEIFKKSVMDSYTYLGTARDYSHHIEKPEKSSVDLLHEIEKVASDLRVLMADRLK